MNAFVWYTIICPEGSCLPTHATRKEVGKMSPPPPIALMHAVYLIIMSRKIMQNMYSWIKDTCAPP